MIFLHLTIVSGLRAGTPVYVRAGTPVYVNAAHLISINPYNGGSEIVLVGDTDSCYVVKETPDQILAQIPAHV